MKIKYIFCISTGRCGTNYLAKLLSTLNNCKAYHEQKPLLHNFEMREYLKGNKTPLQSKIKNKIEIIQKDKNFIYVDTSHLFIKGFGWEIPKYINQNEIGIVILKRDKEKVVKSTQRVHSGPFTYLGRKWIITPNKNNFLKPPVNFYVYSFYRFLLKVFWKINGDSIAISKSYPKFFLKQSIKLINWYYDETYALAELYKQKFPKINFIDVTLEELNSIENFQKIVNNFNLQENFNNEVANIIGMPVNLKNDYS